MSRNSKTIVLEPWHANLPHLLTRMRSFVRDGNDTTQFVLATHDVFLERVANDQDWSLMAPKQVADLSVLYGDEFRARYLEYETGNKAVRVIKARELAKEICETQMQTGMPYQVNKTHEAMSSFLSLLPTFATSASPAAVLVKATADKEREAQLVQVAFEQVRATGEARIPCNELSGEARRAMTLEADRQGLVVYKAQLPSAPKSRVTSVLVITSSVDEVCDASSLTAAQLKTFSDIINVPLDDTATVAADMVLFGVETSTLEAFCDEVRRFGLAGLKRRNRIIHEEIVAHLAAQPNYKALQQKTAEELRMANMQMDEDYTILKRVYNNKNTGRVFFSIDLKSAIVQCYRDAGIIEEACWSDFVARFTSSRMFAQNKFARVRIFGDLDKRNTHAVLWKNAIWNVWQQILAAWPEAKQNLVAIENDEIVLVFPDGASSTDVARFAHELVETCGLGKLRESGRINLRCYTLHPLRLEALVDGTGKVLAPAQSCFIRQMMSMKDGRATGECDIKCSVRPNRKRAMLLAQLL